MASCSGCPATWASTSWAHCGAECHETFLNVTAFDDHRVNGECWGTSTLRAGRLRAHEALVLQNGTWGTPEGHKAVISYGERAKRGLRAQALNRLATSTQEIESIQRPDVPSS